MGNLSELGLGDLHTGYQKKICLKNMATTSTALPVINTTTINLPDSTTVVATAEILAPATSTLVVPDRTTTTTMAITTTTLATVPSETTTTYSLVCEPSEDYSGVVGDCTKYKRCDHGLFVIFQCPPGRIKFKRLKYA